MSKVPNAPKVRRSLSGKVLPPGHKLAPSWHELVQPGPAGDPAKKWKRQAARHRGTIVESTHQPAPKRKPTKPSMFRRAVTRLRSARSV